MEAIIAAMVGLVAVFLAIGAAWIRADIRGVRAAMDERFDRVDGTLREHGERIARMEGALVPRGFPWR